MCAGCGKQKQIGVMGRIKNVTKAVVEIATSDATLASADVQKERLTKCRACEAFNDGRCSDCGCVVSLKVKFIGNAFKCPKGFWQ